MKRYVLIESRDPYEYGDVNYFCNLAGDLAARGNDVTVFLVQNSVLMARKDAQGPLGSLLGKPGKLQVLADDFSLRERAIKPDALRAKIGVSNVDNLVDLLAQDGVNAVWH